MPSIANPWFPPPVRSALRRSLPLAGLLFTLASPGRAQVPDSSLLGLDRLLDRQVSTAAKYTQRVSEVAGSVTIITSEDIERFGYRTLDQVMATVPGFYVSNDRNYSSIGTRGFSRPTDHNNRILVLVDGNTVNEGVFGSAPMGSELVIPMQSIERIEIVRGPGSALYGTGAVFGVVNVITRTTADIDGGRVVAQAGSFGRRGMEALLGHRWENGVGVVLGGLWDRTEGQDFYYREFDSPTTNDGIAPGLDGERRLGLVGSLSRGGLRLHGQYYTRRKAIPTAPYGAAFAAAGSYTWDQHASLQLDYHQELDTRLQLVSRAYYNHYRDNSDFAYADTVVPIVLVTSTTGEELVGSEVALQWDPASSNRFTIGGEVRHSFVAHLLSPRDGPHTSIDLTGPATVVSGYIQDEHQFTPAVSLLAGLRFDIYSGSPNALAPRAGLLVRPFGGAMLKLLYGEAFRAPSVYEREFASGPIIASRDLRPEQIRTLELVWQQQLGTGILWSSSGFSYRMRDLIDLTFNPNTGQLQYRNVSRVRSAGLESGIDFRLGASMSGFASYTYQRTIDGATGDRQTNSPAHLAKGGISLAATPWFRPGLTMRYESARNTVYGTTTDPYFLADLNLLVRPLAGGASGRLELGIRVNNLFNTRFATPSGGELLQHSIPQDGRNMSAELRLGF